MTATLNPVRLTATPQVIAAYGELTNDANPIHIDPDFARGTPMGRCIAHGTLSIALLWQALFRTVRLEAGECVELDVCFIRPVFVGETIEAGGNLQDSDSRCYTVWIRGSDGLERVVGTARLVPEMDMRRVGKPAYPGEPAGDVSSRADSV